MATAETGLVCLQVQDMERSTTVCMPGLQRPPAVALPAQAGPKPSDRSTVIVFVLGGISLAGEGGRGDTFAGLGGKPKPSLSAPCPEASRLRDLLATTWQHPLSNMPAGLLLRLP